MVACTPGLFSLLAEEHFFPEPAAFFLRPLALAGPNVDTFAAWFRMPDFGLDSPETWTQHVHVTDGRSGYSKHLPDKSNLNNKR